MNPKKTGRRKVFAVLIVLLLIASWVISFTGVGSKFGNLGKQLKYGLDINGGVYVLLEADSNGSELRTASCYLAGDSDGLYLGFDENNPYWRGHSDDDPAVM